MTAQLIDGRALAHRLRLAMRDRATTLATNGVRPGLAVVLIGDDPASDLYARNKLRAYEECGLVSRRHRLPSATHEGEVLALIRGLNADPEVHGILVQLPLPPHIDVRRVIESIVVDKDVDGFHLYNRLAPLMACSFYLRRRASKSQAGTRLSWGPATLSASPWR